jgi:hypothetical protein
MQLVESLPVSTKIIFSYLFPSYFSLSYSLKTGEVKTTRKIMKLCKPIFNSICAFLDSKQGAFSKLNLLLIKSWMEFYLLFAKYLNIANIRMALSCLFVSRFNGRHINTQDWNFLQSNAFTNVRFSYNTHAMNRGSKVDVSWCQVPTDSTTALPSQTFPFPVDSMREEATER